MSKYKEAIEVLKCEYSEDTKMKYGCCVIEQGRIEVLVVTTPNRYDVWNIHPLRKGWQKVYTLEECNPEQQVKESLASLKRLFEKEN